MGSGDSWAWNKIIWMWIEESKGFRSNIKCKEGDISHSLIIWEGEMTKPQLHFDINIPVTFLAQKKEAMTTRGKEKKEKIVLLGIVYVQVLIYSSLFLLIFHSLSLCPSSRKASLTRKRSIYWQTFVCTDLTILLLLFWFWPPIWVSENVIMFCKMELSCLAIIHKDKI